MMIKDIIKIVALGEKLCVCAGLSALAGIIVLIFGFIAAIVIKKVTGEKWFSKAVLLGLGTSLITWLGCTVIVVIRLMMILY